MAFSLLNPRCCLPLDGGLRRLDCAQYSAIRAGARLKLQRACHLELSQRAMMRGEGRLSSPLPWWERVDAMRSIADG